MLTNLVPFSKLYCKTIAIGLEIKKGAKKRENVSREKNRYTDKQVDREIEAS